MEFLTQATEEALEHQSPGHALLKEILEKSGKAIPEDPDEAYKTAVDALYAQTTPLFRELQDRYRNGELGSDEEFLQQQKEIETSREEAYQAILEKYPPTTLTKK